MNKGMLFGLFVLSLLVLVGGVSAVGDVSITNLPNLVVNPLGSVTGNVTVVNMMVGDPIPFVLLTSSDLVSGSNHISAPSINDLVNLGNDAQTVYFSINVGSIPAGVYTGTITAEESGNSANKEVKSYNVVVNSVTMFDLDKSSITLTGQSDDSVTGSFTITNKGSIDLTNIVITHDLNLTDDDGDKITLNFNNVPSSVALGSSATIEVEAEIGDDVALGTYDGEVTVTINGVAKTFDLKINVQPDICKDGIVGKLKISDINEPGDGDNFEIGDVIDIEVDVDNDADEDLDVVVEAILYNLDEDEELETVESEETEIEEGKDETFELQLEISGDDELDEDDEYVIYIKAYEDGNEDEYCIFDSVEIELERKKHHIVVTEVDVPNTVSCGELLEVSADIENWGTSDEDEVTVELYIAELNYRQKSTEYELEAYDEDDNDASVTFSVSIPKDADEREYTARFKTYYGSKVSVEETAKFTVEGNCEGSADDDDGDDTDNNDGPKLGDAGITLPESSFDAEAGDELSVQVEVTNNKDSSESYTVSVDGISGWATSLGDQTVTLASGQKSTVYVYLTLEDDLDGGKRGAVVNVRENGNVVASQTLSVEVEEAAGNFFAENSTWLWIIGYIVLIIVAIILIKLLFTKPRNRNTYYTDMKVR